VNGVGNSRDTRKVPIWEEFSP